jgi:cyanophycin synthetase
VIGLDIITTDISQPLQQSGGSIIEFNATPGFSSPMLVSTNLAKILLEYIFNENVDH